MIELQVSTSNVWKITNYIRTMCIEALRIKIVWNHDRLLQAHVSTDCRKSAHGIVDSYHVYVFRNDDSGLLDSLRSAAVRRSLLGP